MENDVNPESDCEHCNCWYYGYNCCYCDEPSPYSEEENGEASRLVTAALSKSVEG